MSAFSLISLALLSSFAESTFVLPQVAASSSISTQKPRVGDTVEVHYIVDIDGNPLVFVFDSLLEPLALGLSFVGSETRTTTRKSSESLSGTTELIMRFVPNRAGRVRISDYTIRLLAPLPAGGDSLSFDTVAVRFSGFELDVLPPRRTGLFVALALFLLGIGAFAGAIVFMTRLAASQGRRLLEQKPPPTPEDRALAELARIAPQRLETRELAERLSRTLRAYISERFGVPALKLSTQEVISLLGERGLGGRRFVAIEKVLRFCDDILFAGKLPTADEIAEALDSAKEAVSG